MRKPLISPSSWLAGLSLLGMAAVAQAQITYDEIGTANPPATLGTWGMTEFAPDTYNNPPAISYDDVTQVPAPNATFLSFSEALNHDTIGDGWATWGQSYLGDVYDTTGQPDNSVVTITLPASTHAFDFYAEPADFASLTITAVDQDGDIFTQTVDGNGGASGFGFYDDTGVLTSVTVSSSDYAFAVGEFGISMSPTAATVPDGGSTLWYSALSLLTLVGLAPRIKHLV